MDTNQRTPLMWAARLRHISVVNLLLSKGADDRLVDRYGDTALRNQPSWDAARTLMATTVLKDTAPPLSPDELPPPVTGRAQFFNRGKGFRTQALLPQPVVPAVGASAWGIYPVQTRGSLPSRENRAPGRSLRYRTMALKVLGAKPPGSNWVHAANDLAVEALALDPKGIEVIERNWDGKTWQEF
ncbi:MAG: ankyrin repeat domain-containing protein [Kovacikia sp.]